MVFLVRIACFATVISLVWAVHGEQPEGKILSPQPDGLIIAEGEDFTSTGPGWKAGKWGENYYAATFANSFLSRKAFLGASEQCEKAAASQKVQIAKAGKYQVLVRYEAAYRFETQFTLSVQQGGKKVLERLYGARKNLKIWAFSQRLKDEVAWDWGAGENLVWEGHDAFADLQAGVAEITLIAQKQPEPAARRNIDLVMLTTDHDQVKQRIEKENYLPLDGMLTQSGDVWLRVSNPGNQVLTFASAKGHNGGNWQEHSPYWVHIRKWQPVSVRVEEGKASDWVEVGGLMDSLNDGQWTWTSDGPYKAEFAMGSDKKEIIGIFSGGKGSLVLAADADTRRSKRIRKIDQVLYDLLDYLDKQPIHGKTPTRTPIFASTFTPLEEGKHQAAVARFKKMFALAETEGEGKSKGRGYVDVRGVATEKLAEFAQKMGDKAKEVVVVSLGDEIGLPTPGKSEATNVAFQNWLKSQGVTPQEISPAFSQWQQVIFSPEVGSKSQNPRVFYWSQRYLYHFGIQGIKQRTDILRGHFPNAGIGANFSPHYPTEHMFLGEVFKWISVFRQDGMTLPWSEDYIWQVPVGTPQMNNISLDLFRAGIRGKEGRKIHYYVMPHAPNNTPDMWRRLFYGALGHGMKMVNLFEFRPVQVAYTENHVSDPAMYASVLRGFNELGLFEDIVQDGKVREGETGLWFSETSDIWGDTHGSFGAAKRALYIAIRNQQVPLDFLVDADAQDGTLKKYKALYLTDRHITRQSTAALISWVKQGGTLFLTAGAGMRDELDQKNSPLMELAGIQDEMLVEPKDAQVKFIKQDLPFAEPIDSVHFENGKTIPVIGVKSQSKTQGVNVEAKFKDGSPAVFSKTAGKGKVIYCGFLPGLSYFKPAIPKKPFDRGANENAMVHFLPMDFDSESGKLIGSAVHSLVKPVNCSNSLVESTIIDSPHGLAISLVNWSSKPIVNLQVELNFQVKGQVTLASGKKVAVKRDGVKTLLQLDLQVADTLICR